MHNLTVVLFCRQKLQQQADQQQRQADIRICQGEVQTLQKELDAISGTLHQLESQKKDAQKALDDLDDKVRHSAVPFRGQNSILRLVITSEI